jgi:hypothetical protein
MGLTKTEYAVIPGISNKNDIAFTIDRVRPAKTIASESPTIIFAMGRIVLPEHKLCRLSGRTLPVSPPEHSPVPGICDIEPISENGKPEWPVQRPVVTHLVTLVCINYAGAWLPNDQCQLTIIAPQIPKSVANQPVIPRIRNDQPVLYHLGIGRHEQSVTGIGIRRMLGVKVRLAEDQISLQLATSEKVPIEENTMIARIADDQVVSPNSDTPRTVEIPPRRLRHWQPKATGLLPPIDSNRPHHGLAT